MISYGNHNRPLEVTDSIMGASKDLLGVDTVVGGVHESIGNTAL